MDQIPFLEVCFSNSFNMTNLALPAVLGEGAEPLVYWAIWIQIAEQPGRETFSSTRSGKWLPSVVIKAYFGR
jgi:hypothetical protein